MKQKILIFSLLFFVAVASMQAQVNIGSADNPTDEPALFLPAAGARNSSNSYIDAGCFYWSSTAYSDASQSSAYGFHVYGNMYPTLNNTRGDGFSIRCVAE